jgi:hypothetical protein
VYHLRMHENSAISRNESRTNRQTLRRPVSDPSSFSRTSPIVREVSALQEALFVLSNDRASPEAGRRLAQKALASRVPNSHLNLYLDRVIQTALCRIAQKPLPVVPKQPETNVCFEQRSIETTAQAWLVWASGNEPGFVAREHARLQEESSRWTTGAGALHRATLGIWFDAIERLDAGDFPEAKRLWNRAIALGSSLGTESHPAILWSYAASFFP